MLCIGLSVTCQSVAKFGNPKKPWLRISLQWSQHTGNSLDASAWESPDNSGTNFLSAVSSGPALLCWASLEVWRCWRPSEVMILLGKAKKPMTLWTSLQAQALGNSWGVKSTYEFGFRPISSMLRSFWAMNLCYLFDVRHRSRRIERSARCEDFGGWVH